MTMTETSTANEPAGRSGSREKDRATRGERPDQQVQTQAAELASAQRQAEELVLDQAVQRLRDDLGEARNGAGGQQRLLIARQRLMTQLHDLDQQRARSNWQRPVTAVRKPPPAPSRAQSSCSVARCPPQQPAQRRSSTPHSDWPSMGSRSCAESRWKSSAPPAS